MMSESDFIKHLTNELLSVDRFSRDSVFETFEPYVQNKDLLKKCVDIGDLHYDYVKFRTMLKDTIFEIGLSYIIELAQQAFVVSPEKTAIVLSEGYRSIVLSLAHYTQSLWGSFPEIKDTRLDVFVKTAFSRIGDLIENSLKPYLITINELRCIIENKIPKQKKLGVIVDVLMQYNPIFKSLYSDLFLGISVAQWRNIADHGDYKLTREGIEIEYGPEQGRKKKLVSKADLVYILTALDNVLYMNKTARTFLSIDYHGHYSSEAGRSEKTIYAQNDDLLMQLVETSYAYGFIILSIDLQQTPCIVDIDQCFGMVCAAEIKAYLNIMCALIEKPYSFHIYRGGKVEYTADFDNKQLTVLKYIVK